MEETLMRKLILANLTIFAFVTGMTTGATAFDRKAGHGGHHVRGFHAGGTHSSGTKRSNRLAGVRGPIDRGGFIDLGPLGITAACGSSRHQHGYCGSGYSVSAWSY
jgi:hypothetical protein